MPSIEDRLAALSATLSASISALATAEAAQIAALTVSINALATSQATQIAALAASVDLLANSQNPKTLKFSILNDVTGVATGDFIYVAEENISYVRTAPIPVGITIAAASSWVQGHQPPNITMSVGNPGGIVGGTFVYDVTANSNIGMVEFYSGTTLNVDGLRISSVGSSDILFFNVGTPTETGLHIFASPSNSFSNFLLAGSVTEIIDIIGSSKFISVTLVDTSLIHLRIKDIAGFFPANYGVSPIGSSSNVRIVMNNNSFFDVVESEATIATAIGDVDVVT